LEPSYDIGELVRETEQPENYLREILEEICEFQKKGKGKGQYSLKKEFQSMVQ
jgi:transcription initiation factor TFIIF subunit beta